MKRIPPRREQRERMVFMAINVRDSSDRFEIDAPNEKIAQILLTEKLGFVIERTSVQNDFELVDVDNKKRRFPLEAKSWDDAYSELFAAAGWKISEPMMFMDGNDD